VIIPVRSNREPWIQATDGRTVPVCKRIGAVRRLFSLVLLLSSVPTLAQTSTPAFPPESQDRGVYRVGGGVTSPALLYKVEPEYTQEARRAGIQGTVLLYLQVDPAGRGVNIRVLHGLGLGLDENAIAAIKTWKFRPGTKGGKPVTVEAQIEMTFRLINPESSPVTALRQDGANDQKPDQLDFEGAMETATELGISIRLPDGRIVEVALTIDSGAMEIASIKERFIGDIVHIRCRPIPQVYDPVEDSVRVLGLTGIRFVRAPTQKELSAALASRHRFNSRNRLKVGGVLDADLRLSLKSLRLSQNEADLRKSPRLGSDDDFIEKSQSAIAAYLAKG
jgi:TonB family protein